MAVVALIASLPFESTRPSLADQAKSESPTSGLFGIGALKTVGQRPVGRLDSPSTTSIVTPSGVPSYPTSEQSSRVR